MFKSIRWSLLFWYSIILLFATGGLGGAMYFQQRHARRQTMDADLSSSVEVLTVRVRLVPEPGFRPGFDPGLGPDFRPPPPLRDGQPRPPREEPEPPPGERSRPPGEQPSPPVGGIGLPDGVLRRYEEDNQQSRYFVIWHHDDTFARSSLSTAAARDVPLPQPASEIGQPPRVQFRNRDRVREAFLVGPGGTLVLVGKPTSFDDQELQNLLGILAATGAAILLIGLLAGWLLTNQILRPIEAIQKTAQSISETNLSERINVAKTHSELGGLAHVLNSMFARLQAAFERQTQFAADASHELRTPLAVIHTEAESALNKPRSPEEYSAALETCLRAAKRMRPLVESLLVLARGDAGKLQLRRETFDLKNTVEDCAALVESLAAERKVSLTLDLQPVQLHADPFRLTQVVANILTNAILYNRPGGTAQATLRSENNFAILTISDTGLGIPPEHLPRIFERFYRVEESRSRELGGAGLGLAICKSIIDAHQGTITATSEVHYGTTFVVRLPLGC